MIFLALFSLNISLQEKEKRTTFMGIDHIFIHSQSAAPEAKLLKSFGLIEASANTHLGQGTANRRFFFKNLFLELLFLENIEDAQSETTKPTQLFERLSHHDAEVSPFGFCFRPQNATQTAAPFLSWHYHPAYLPPHLHVDIAQQLSLAEPMWFYLSFATRPDQAAPEKQQPFQHRHGISEVTKIKLHIPKLSESLTVNEVQHIENFELIESKKHLLEMTFNHGIQGLTHDFRPDLPLIFHY